MNDTCNRCGIDNPARIARILSNGDPHHAIEPPWVFIGANMFPNEPEPEPLMDIGTNGIGFTVLCGDCVQWLKDTTSPAEWDRLTQERFGYARLRMP